MGGDTVQGVIDKAWLHGPRYELARRFTVKGAPAIEIYRRVQIEANQIIPTDHLRQTDN
jgi:hypothetical protein